MHYLTLIPRSIINGSVHHHFQTSVTALKFHLETPQREGSANRVGICSNDFSHHICHKYLFVLMVETLRKKNSEPKKRKTMMCLLCMFVVLGVLPTTLVQKMILGCF